MDYLQYIIEDIVGFPMSTVLNLVINGLPSILKMLYLLNTTILTKF